MGIDNLLQSIIFAILSEETSPGVDPDGYREEDTLGAENAQVVKW